MKAPKQEKEYTRENFALSPQEVPLFPFRPAGTAHPDMDEMEQAQLDFVQQAGQPDKQ